MRHFYEVQTYSLADGWQNTWTVGEGETESPEIFFTIKDAQKAVSAEIKRTKDAIRDIIRKGVIVKGPAVTKADFRIVKKWGF